LRLPQRGRRHLRPGHRPHEQRLPCRRRPHRPPLTRPTGARDGGPAGIPEADPSDPVIRPPQDPQARGRRLMTIATTPSLLPSTAGALAEALGARIAGPADAPVERLAALED